MDPYRIEMQISSYTKDGKPLYTLTEYDKSGSIVKQLSDISKQDAAACMACIFGTIYIARQNGKR